MEAIFGNLLDLEPRLVIMWIIGGILIYLAIKKDMEPSLLLPMGFGAILVNLPNSGAITQGEEIGVLNVLYDAGIANELFPLLLFIGIGAMIDFGPLLQSPYLLIFGAAAQLGIFVTVSLACLFGFELKDAASIGIIGAADGPTAIFVSQYFGSNYTGAIMVAAYSYMALVPIIQPPVVKLLTTKKERTTHMKYAASTVSKQTRILFPILVTLIAGLIVPRSVALVGFLMFGNLLRECGVLDSLSKTAQDVLANLITIFLGITIASRLYSGTCTSGESAEMDAIAAVVVGGTSMSGGSGRLGGTLIGALIIGILDNGLNLMGVNSDWQFIIKGVVILGAVYMDFLRSRKRAKG